MNKRIIAGVVAAATAGGAYFLVPSDPPPGHLYAMRGLFGGDGKDQAIEAEYSRGVDVFAAKAEVTHKVKIDVTAWHQWRPLCERAVANYRKDKAPVFLVGHSLGASNVAKVAHCLEQAKVPVSFALFLDPTPFVGCVPANVKYATSWRRSFPLDLGGGHIKRCDGSTKNTANITLKNSRHVLIDDYAVVHDGGLARIGIGIKEAFGGKG